MLVILGGVHGNERPGIELVQTLSQSHLPSIQPILANPRASQDGMRFFHENMNLLCPSKLALHPLTYEAYLSNELLDTLSDIAITCVIDVHSTKAPDNTCLIVVDTEVKPIYHLIGHILKIPRILWCPGETTSLIGKLPEHTPKVGIELSESDWGDRYSLSMFQSKLQRISRSFEQAHKARTLPIYRERLALMPIQIPDWAWSHLHNFTPLTPSIQQALFSFASDALYPSFIGESDHHPIIFLTQVW